MGIIIDGAQISQLGEKFDETLLSILDIRTGMYLLMTGLKFRDFVKSSNRKPCQ